MSCCTETLCMQKAVRHLLKSQTDKHNRSRHFWSLIIILELLEQNNQNAIKSLVHRNELFVFWGVEKTSDWTVRLLTLFFYKPMFSYWIIVFESLFSSSQGNARGCTLSTTTWCLYRVGDGFITTSCFNSHCHNLLLLCPVLSGCPWGNTSALYLCPKITVYFD